MKSKVRVSSAAAALLAGMGAACLAALTASTLLEGCGDSQSSEFGDRTDAGNSAEAGDLALPPGTYQDFPESAIVEGTAPTNAKDLFAGAEVGGAGGPCLMEPEVGSMFPRNWLRPRFRWIDAGSLAADSGVASAPKLFELRLHAENQTRDLVVYTTSSAWTMPGPMWAALRLHSAGVPMTVSIRGGAFDGTSLSAVAEGSSGPLSIAPVDAPGTIVYWTSIAGGPTDGGYNPVLKGFRVGDESTAEVLTPGQLTPAGSSRCLGCHTSTPDGLYAAVANRPDPDQGTKTFVDLASVDGFAAAPSYVSPTARTLLAREEQTVPSFSPAHFTNGDRVAVTLLRGGQGFDLAWTDLETSSMAQGTGWGIFDRTGDSDHVALADVSHDGTKIVYVSTPDQDTGGAVVQQGRLFVVPYGNRQGGTATPIAGANEDGFKSFYPTFSPDDELVAYDRSPAGTSSYADPNAELYVIPTSGGTPLRLGANDPPACSGAKSPGVFNAWPKWAPEVATDGGKKYYFLVFSSARNHGTARFGARLYIAPVVVSGGTITTYAAIYLWNQPELEDNHSPAWDTFKIPPLR